MTKNDLSSNINIDLETGDNVHILVINSGSTSLRFCLVNSINNSIISSGGVENIGTPEMTFKYKNFKGNRIQFKIQLNSYDEILNIIFRYLLDSNIGVLDSFDEIEAIGHRIIHGADKYIEPTIIDDQVYNDIKLLSFIAPLHNEKILFSINSCMKKFPSIKNIGVFDTSFHLTIPRENYTYSIPKDLTEKHKIRKYGFHGISYSYVLNRYSELINKDIKDINTVMCHLGGGSSICAVKNGKSFNTTMGYSPLSGLIMVTRSGDIDPTIILSIMDAYNVSAKEAIELLNNESGYYAMANVKDAKSLVEKSLAGDEDAIFLRKCINNDFKKHLLGMMANLNTVDSIILTGGIGAKNIEQREMLLSDLDFFDIKLDKDKNKSIFNSEGIISSDNSKIPIYVIPTNEELEIAKQCQKVLKR